MQDFVEVNFLGWYLQSWSGIREKIHLSVEYNVI